MNRRLLLSGTLAALAVAAGPAAAQAPDSLAALTPGMRSISVELPNGGGSVIGLWKMRSRDVNSGLLLGVHVAASFDSHDTIASSNTQTIALSIGPAFRRYITRAAPVAPFGYTKLVLGGMWQRQHYEDPRGSATGRGWSANAGVALGIGAEWFPATRMSIAAQTGLQASVQYVRPNPEEHRWDLGLNTFTSAVSLQLYF